MSQDTLYLLNLNGKILAPTHHPENGISPLDRGFLYGDSLYEVMRTRNQKFFQLDAHLHRLEQSAKLCRLNLNPNIERLKIELEKSLEAFNKQIGTEAYCRLVITRGIGNIGFGLSQLWDNKCFYTIILKPLILPTPAQAKKGLSLQISSRMRNPPQALDPAMKSGNYLNNLLAFLEAEENKFDDALLLNQHGHVTEGTTFNVFYIKNASLVTPPLDIGILDGITRRDVLSAAQSLAPNIRDVREVRFPKERLYEADEVFVTSTLKDVFPVTKIDQKIIGNGDPGSITQLLLKKYQTLYL